MADDGSEKSPKTAIEVDVTAVMQGRIAQLESEVIRLRFENAQLHGRIGTAVMQGRIAQLESEVQRLRFENAQLHGRIGQLEGNHKVLPLAIVPVVELSRVDTSIVDHVALFGKSRELLNLALTQLESENQRLRSENEHLHGRIRQLEGYHEVLPIVVVPFAVDLSRVDTNIVKHVASFIGKSRELLNLALTCKSFGLPQPGSTQNWSLVEGVARRAVRSRATDAEMSSLPTYTSGTTTWMSILHRFEHLLDFDVLFGFGRAIKHIMGVRSAITVSDEWGDDDAEHNVFCTAVSSGYVMTSGVHYAEFNNIAGNPSIGIVRPMPGLDSDRFDENYGFFGMHYEDFLAQRSDDWGGNIHACEYNTIDDTLNWTNWGEEEGFKQGEWVGCTSEEVGTISIVLNLDEGTIAVYDRAYAVHKVLSKDGLSGPYCWYVRLMLHSTISIKRGTSQT